jgi:transposase
MQAAVLFAKGKTQADVTRALSVSRQSASQWYAQWKTGGAGALRGAGRAGRKPRLTPKDLRHLDTALRRGARAHGFATDLWTLPRVATAIEKITGIQFHPAHAWRLLKQIGWSLQRPAKRARERNEEGIRRWKAGRWPALKKTPGESVRGSSSKTKAASPSSLPSDGLGLPAVRPRS